MAVNPLPTPDDHAATEVTTTPDLALVTESRADQQATTQSTDPRQDAQPGRPADATSTLSVVPAGEALTRRGVSNEPEGMYDAITRPRLAAVLGADEHDVPATARYAGELTDGALALRHQAIIRLGVASAPRQITARISLSALSPADADETGDQATTTEATPVGASDNNRADKLDERRPDGTQAPLKSDATAGTAASTRHTASASTSAGAGARLGAGASIGAGVVARGVVREGVPGLPDARLWGGRLAQAVSEVLSGDRPISQLVRFTDDQVFLELNRRVRLLGLNSTAGSRGAKEKSAVRSVRVFMPQPSIAEVAAHVRHGDRSRAVALRLEIRRNRWVCTALELG